MLISCLSAKSSPEILFIKDECTILFSNFQLIGLCSSPANSLICMISFLSASLEVFYQKIYKSLKPDPFDTHDILDFYQY